MPTLRFLILALVAILFAGPALASDDRPPRLPNIVLIVGDDLGYPYAGFMGDPIVLTPNLDRLAAEGTTFTHAFSPSSVCRPALQTLLSGLHPRSWNTQRIRIEDAIGEMIPQRTEIPHYVTLPRQLGRQGYRSFQGGKHWEGHFARAGFDAGTTGDFQNQGGGSPDWRIFARLTLDPLYDFLDGIEEDEPFFLYVAPMLPHTPHDPHPLLRYIYERLGLATSAVGYYANITRFDTVVGRTVAALEARGLRDNTLIIYVSDNGWEQAPDVQATTVLERVLGGSRGKLSIYDLGFRTPLIFNWPGQVPENEVFDDLVTFRDLHATILQYAGAPIPPDHEGISLIPRIEGSGGPARDHVVGAMDLLRARQSEYIHPFIVTFDASGFLRTDQWRYIEWLDRGTQALFRIEDDPLERDNLADQFPEVVAEFAARTEAWREALNQPAAWMDLTGRLATEDRMPASGLRLWLEGIDQSGASRRLEVFSNPRGFFRFPNVPAGDYTLTYEIEAPEIIGRWRRSRRTTATQSMEIDLNGYETGPFSSLKFPAAHLHLRRWRVDQAPSISSCATDVGQSGPESRCTYAGGRKAAS